MTNAKPVGCEEFFSYLETLFSVSENDMRAMIRDFHVEMKKGLRGDDGSLKMIPSFIDRPKGDEKGQFLALDLGGTNFRVLAVILDGKGRAVVPAAGKFAIPPEHMRGTGVALFDFIAGCIDRFLIENRIDRSRTHDLAFTFSFPVEQTAIAAGKLMVWTKGFTATGVKGRDVIVLLHDALKRKGIHCINITALANDAVGTLAAGSYRDPACDLGVILGTGTNACYREAVSRIEKLKTVNGTDHMIVNMEWGNFHKVRHTPYDNVLDKGSVNPGAMFLEKMVSGMYLGEITRLVLIDLMEKGLLFPGDRAVRASFREKDSFKTADMSLFEGDGTDDLGKIGAFLEGRGIFHAAFGDRFRLKHLCRIVSRRAARLGGAAICAVLTWGDPELQRTHTVAIDGSLFEKYPGFKGRMKRAFTELYREKAEKITLVHSKDGSGKGAAIIAAVAAGRK